jgi:hypothetical protein
MASELDDILRFFTWCVANAAWIKVEHQRRTFRAQQERELAELEADPAISSILAAFPGASIKFAEQSNADS